MVAGSTSPSYDEGLDDAPDQESSRIGDVGEAEEADGSLAHSEELDKLMRSVLENDKDFIPEGMMLSEGVNHGLRSFSPDMLADQLVNQYRQAKELYGERFIRELTGYDPSYVEKNVRIPEFQRELRDRVQQSIKSLKDEGLLDGDESLTEEGFTVAALALTADELDKLDRQGALGERDSRARADEGEASSYAPFRQHHRFRDLALKASIKKSLRRGHESLSRDDFVALDRESRQRASIVYAVDASGSMKGDKLAAAKRAGIALSFKATRKRDRVGLVVFGREVEASLQPTGDFLSLARLITRAQASKETDLAATLRHSAGLLEHEQGVKHVLLLTDGLQTVGQDPTERVLEAASEAAQQGITVSVVGLSLDEEGEALSKRVVEVGGGSLYLLKNYEDLDVLLLEDYYHAARRGL